MYDGGKNQLLFAGMQTTIHDKSIASCSLFHTRTPPSIFGDLFLWACSDHRPSTVVLSGNNGDNLPRLPHCQNHQNDLPTYSQSVSQPVGGPPYLTMLHRSSRKLSCLPHQVQDWASHEYLFLLQHSQGDSRVKPAGLGCHCTGKGRSIFLPVKRCGMA